MSRKAPEEKNDGEEGGGQITVSSMMKEIRGLKEKFKGDDDEQCKRMSRLLPQWQHPNNSNLNTLCPNTSLQSRRSRASKRQPFFRSAGSSMTLLW
jgi:hypothetical protein